MPSHSFSPCLQEGEGAEPLLPDDDPYLQTKDQSECTPLHVAILNVCSGALPGREGAALQLVQLLLAAGADPMQRDDCGRLALHWSAELGLADVCQLLLQATTTAAAALTARVAAASTDAAENGAAPELDMPNLLEMQLAYFCAAVLAGGQMCLQGPLPCTRHAKGRCLAATTQQTEPLFKHGSSPADLARRRGHTALAQQLASLEQATAAGGPQEQPPSSTTTTTTAGPEVIRLPTLIVAPPECGLHRTCPDPLPRGCPPPPENVERLRVLVTPGRGILHSRGFQGRLAWEERVQPAPIGDVLRVHDWSYVRKLQASRAGWGCRAEQRGVGWGGVRWGGGAEQRGVGWGGVGVQSSGVQGVGCRIACQVIPDSPDAIAHLDPDTAISFHTFHVALRAAASVCLAVDRVVSGAAANAFCAVRPPGHHAGPRGVVSSKKDRTGSHGFCLLNNVAIAAAYAMNVHRHRGIQRVAILDFDVHHGNGTRACVSNTAPGTLRVPFSTPLSEGVHVYQTYQPWFDVDDDDNVLFASVQGYGPKSGSMPDAFVYPGTADDPSLTGPRIIEVGIPGPGAHPLLWRRAWRDKVLPALVNFKPDLILVSAGFDAHKKDEINFRYIGVTEADYEWLTDQIVQVANRCCNGRVVSVLEGGYNINGGIVSAFARSVAAHEVVVEVVVGSRGVDTGKSAGPVEDVLKSGKGRGKLLRLLRKAAKAVTVVAGVCVLLKYGAGSARLNVLAGCRDH
eukprot:gene4555-4807_t